MISIKRPISRFATFALGLGLGLTALLPIQQLWQARLLQQQHIYGSALSQATAREAVAAAFANDRLSLGAIAQQMAATPGVLRVSIYNAENQVLVQGGSSALRLPDEALRFESQITLQDSIAGVVELYLAPKYLAATHGNLYALLAILCFVAALLSFYRNKNFAITLPQRKIKQAPTLQEQSTVSDHTTGDCELDSTSPLAPESKQAYIALRIKNVSVLQKQLNGATFRATFKTFEQQLNTIGALYGASSWRWHNDRYLMEIHSSKLEDALFNCACCAKLLLDLCGIIDRVPLDLSAQISIDEQSLEQAPMPFVGLACSDDSHHAQLLGERVSLLEYGDKDAACLLIAEFSPAYAELLQKQMHNLKQPANISTETREQNKEALQA